MRSAFSRLVMVLLLALTATSALAQSIGGILAVFAPATSSSGAYTVSYSCSSQAICHLEERVGTGGTWSYVGQGGSFSVSGKSPGQYYYRVVAITLFEWGGGGYGFGGMETSAEHLVTVVTGGTTSTGDSYADQMGYNYTARRGDLNFDGRQDLFIERTSGGSYGNGVIDRLILQQSSSGTFTAVVPSASQASAASTWTPVSVEIELKDANLDGFIDLVLHELASAIPGALGQLIFSSGQQSISSPAGLVAITPAFSKFVKEVDSFAQDPNYFYANAPLVYVPVYGLVYSCQWYWDRGWYRSCGFSVGLVGYQIAYDFSGYDQDAVAIGDSFQTVVNGSLTPWLNPGSELARKLEQAILRKLGVPVLRGILSGNCSAVFNIVASDDNPCTLDLDRLGELVLDRLRTLIPQGQWRYLTDGEKAAAREAGLFIKNVDLVKVFNRKKVTFEEYTRNAVAQSADGNIHWLNISGNNPWSEDFSRGDLRPLVILVHELMHVYQYRTWGWSTTKMFREAGRANGDYFYCPLVPGWTITRYNMEEQAEMVSDLFSIGRNGTARRNVCGTAGNLTPIVKPSGGRVPPIG